MEGIDTVKESTTAANITENNKIMHSIPSERGMTFYINQGRVEIFDILYEISQHLLERSYLLEAHGAPIARR
jgi:hypothetical protein